MEIPNFTHTPFIIILHRKLFIFRARVMQLGEETELVLRLDAIAVKPHLGINADHGVYYDKFNTIYNP